MAIGLDQGFAASPKQPASPVDGAPELCRLSAAELTALYRAGRVSPVEVARACLDRAQAVQERCNAFVQVTDTALEMARESEARYRAGSPIGPVDGVPTTLKDLVLIAGQPVGYGTRAAAPVTAERDSPAVSLLRQAGAVFIGRTTTPEFGWKAVTDSAAHGVTRNPVDPRLGSGGSSGGAAVASASGAGVLHLGTDGGGSIRIPAAFCGVVGHKPSFGRVPAAPASPFGTVAHLGPIARSLADAALMLDVLSGRDLRDWHQNPLPFPSAQGPAMLMRGLRIGLWRAPPGGNVEPEVAAAFEECVERLSRAGAVLADVALPFLDELPELFRIHWFAGAAQRLRGLDTAGMDPGLVEVAAAGAAIPLADYLAAMTRRAGFGAAMDALMADHDVLLSPAVAIRPPPAGSEVPPGSGMTRWTDWAGFSYPINLWQAPATVMPTRTPMVGLQVVAARGQDAIAFAAAHAISEVP